MEKLKTFLIKGIKFVSYFLQAPPPSMGAPLPMGSMPSVPVPQQQQQQPQYGQYMQPQQMGQQQMSANNQFQPQQAFMNPPAAMGNTQNPTPEPAAAQIPPQPKAPLPEEYVYMQTVFNELRQQCSNAANNPVSGHEY